MVRLTDKSFRFFGRVIDAQIQGGIAGLRVEGWYKDRLVGDFLGSATTDW